MSIDETAGIDMMPEEDNNISSGQRRERKWVPWVVRFLVENETHKANKSMQERIRTPHFEWQE